MKNHPSPTEPKSSRLVFATGMASLATAALLAVHITLEPDGPPPLTEAATPENETSVSQNRPSPRIRVAAPIQVPMRKPERSDISAQIENPGQHGMRATQPGALANASQRERDLENCYHVEVDPTHPNRAMLLANAEQIGRVARKKMEIMDRRLKLSDEQLDRLFPILVTASENYHPAMRIGGSAVATLSPTESNLEPTTGSSLDEASAIAAVLDAGQAEQQLENSLADQAIWREIFMKLALQLEQNTPRLSAESSPDATSPSSSPRRTRLPTRISSGE